MKKEDKKQKNEKIIEASYVEEVADETKTKTPKDDEHINIIKKENTNTNTSNRRATNLNDVSFEILWEGKPAGLLQRFLTKMNLNFTTYQITRDEIIIISGFFKRRLNSCELYLLKDPDLTDNIYQRMLDISTITVRVDTHTHDPNSSGRIIKLKNIHDGSKVRKLLRDAIEDDVMERKITYFDKV